MLGQLADHAGGGAPDEGVAPGDPVDGVVSARSRQGEGDVMGRVQHVAQGHLEGLRDLILAQGQAIAGVEHGQHRQHIVAGDGIEGGETADDPDLGGGDAELLLGFPERGVNEVPVFRVLATAGKADLPRVVAQGGAAARQQQVQALGALHQGAPPGGRFEPGQ